MSRIQEDARQVIYNVYLYFVNEAEKFQKKEDGYFQKVQERVSTACCVSKRFVQNLLKENKIQESSSSKALKWRKKRKLQEEKLQERISEEVSSDDKDNPITIVTIRRSVPTPLTPISTLELASVATERKLPILTPISKSEMATLPKFEMGTPSKSEMATPPISVMPPPLKPFVFKSNSPPPLTPLASKPSYAKPLRIQTKCQVKPAFKEFKSGLTYIATETVPIEYDPLDNNVWIKSENLSDYQESGLS